MDRLRDVIRRLPDSMEFVIVVVGAFGQLIFSSLLSTRYIDPGAMNEMLASALVVNVLQFAFLVWFLRLRDWTLARIGLSITVRGTLLGLALLVASVATIVVANAVGILLQMIYSYVPRPMHAASNVDFQVLLLLTIVTAVYEELFVSGYVITALSRRRGPWVAINVSTGIRVLCHLYQGPIAVLTTVPLGLLYGYTYIRSRQLWPLILARVLLEGGVLVFFLRGAR
ncbi:MAG TPA: type II CAAX endopeptidase family protein [Steroidobacteraceae bacterium]|nr:type II CAAX endopeptidase family protein [Steroidobacteraceae bacterium]